MDALLTFILDPNNNEILKDNSLLPVPYKNCMDKLFRIFNQIVAEVNSQTSNHPGPTLTQTQTQSLDLPELFSENFYRMAYKVQKVNRNYLRTKKQLDHYYPSLTQITWDQFKSMCQENFPQLPKQNLEAERMQENPTSSDPVSVNYHFYHNLPAGEKKKQGPWSTEETTKLKKYLIHGVQKQLDYITKERTVRWGLLSLFFPGRTGKQCWTKYKQLVKAGEIIQLTDIQDEDTVTRFAMFTQGALLPYKEQELKESLEEMLMANEHVTPELITKKANEEFNDPEHLAKKAAINFCLENDVNFQGEDGEYLEIIDQIIDEHDLIRIAKDEPQIIQNNYHVRPFRATRSWVHRFMKKNNFVIRKAHYMRRGTIDERDIDNYLAHLQSAIERYSPDRILNMDETAVQLFNVPDRVVAKKGQETVKVSYPFYTDKTKTTYIGTISMDPNLKIPLYCIAMGKTQGCEEKYQNENCAEFCKMDHSENGWSTIEVMQRYFQWISDFCNNEPIALVLDAYSTHTDQQTQAFAQQHNIELIFVPPNGTSKYQPLDRRIFGILKRHLMDRIDALDSVSQRRDLFGIVHEQVVRIWQGLSKEAIESAWRIPGLNLGSTPPQSNDAEQSDLDFSDSENDSDFQEYEIYSESEDNFEFDSESEIDLNFDSDSESNSDFESGF